MMKRTVVGILTAVVVLGAGTVGVLAAGTGARHNGLGNGTGICIHSENECNYVDNNGDGICDNIEGGTGQNNVNRVNYVDENGDGICDNQETGSGQNSVQQVADQNNDTRSNFVDDNGDGICDNRNADCIGIRRNGQGRGCRR